MRIESKVHEECAVFGVSLNIREAAGVTYNGLLALQHRGQEGAGIAVTNDNYIVCHKDLGLVSEVFSKQDHEALPKGKTAIGHTRYSTTGGSVKENVGPFLTEYLTGRIATAHNGNVSNASEIRGRLTRLGLHFNATSDSEVISSLIAYCITKETNIIRGVTRAASSLRGAFTLCLASADGKLIALRDPNGFRPLCIGRNETGYAVSSESCAFDACGFEFVRDVLPGEVVVMENGRIVYNNVKLWQKENDRGICIFEYVYLARSDSVIDSLSVYEARKNMGQILAEEHPTKADIVCGVPDSGLDAAAGYSAYSLIPLDTAFVKNRYIGRSFIYPTQSQREGAVHTKLNPLKATIKGKNVILVDDSIVRGTTTGRIVKSLKNAGASEIHVRVSSPPFKNTCHYGTDIDSEENLIANKMSLDDFRKRINADSIRYISIEGLKKACKKCALPFCTACFTGNNGTRQRKDVFE